MSTWILFIIVALVGYICGSISFAVIICRIHGIDIFNAGSGSAGATNVRRVLGKKAGNMVFILDFTKGVIATAWPFLFLNIENLNFYLGLTGLVSAVLGHSFSIFLKFRGGKGIATTMGGILILMPLALLVGLIFWIIIFYTTRYVSLASIIFALSLPITAFLLNETKERIILGIILALLILIRHRTNIKRLMQGTENRFAKNDKS